jgi:hypothetical protein
MADFEHGREVGGQWQSAVRHYMSDIHRINANIDFDSSGKARKMAQLEQLLSESSLP